MHSINLRTCHLSGSRKKRNVHRRACESSAFFEPVPAPPTHQPHRDRPLSLSSLPSRPSDASVPHLFCSVLMMDGGGGESQGRVCARPAADRPSCLPACPPRHLPGHCGVDAPRHTSTIARKYRYANAKANVRLRELAPTASGGMHAS